MYFSCEEERMRFKTAIEKAEQEYENGEYYTQKEVEERLKNQYGIILE